MADIRSRLSGKGTAFGTWLAIDSPVSAEIVAKAGYDFVIIDTQHGGISLDHVLPLLQIFDAHDVPALVRVEWLEPSRMMRVVDLGAAGVIVPMVSTPEQARLAAEAIRYPPKGFRSFGPVRNYYAADGSNAEPLCLVMVETAEALGNLDAIASTPGVDGILVGPVDLALSLGLGLSFEMQPRIFEAMDAVVAACRKHDILSASAGLGIPNALELKDHGVQLVAVNSDNQMIRRAAAEDIAQLKGRA